MFDIDTARARVRDLRMSKIPSYNAVAALLDACDEIVKLRAELEEAHASIDSACDDGNRNADMEAGQCASCRPAFAEMHKLRAQLESLWRVYDAAHELEEYLTSDCGMDKTQITHLRFQLAAVPPRGVNGEQDDESL